MPRQVYDCRFCLQTDEKRNLIAPCICKGGSKYVHNHCLMEWYSREPEKGRRCNVCSYVYHQEYTSPIEDIENMNIFVYIHLQYPLLSIIVLHWAYLTLFPYSHSYTIYQFVWNSVMGFEYLRLVYRVKNRKTYAMHWKKFVRPLLPSFHSYLLLSLPKTGILGGIAANMCMIYYFYEHYDIVITMNKGVQTRFLSRPRM